MIKLILTAHGNLSSGFESALDLIAGQQEDITIVNFEAGMSSDELKAELKLALSGCKEAIILSDLLGGTPFKTAVEIKQETSDVKLAVLTGLNLALLLDACFSRLTYDFDDLVVKLCQTGKEAVVNDIELFETQTQDVSFDDGI